MAERLVWKGIAAKSFAGASEAASDAGHAGIGQRVLAYALDSLVLFGFLLIFATLAGLDIILRSDSGRSNPSDSAYWQFVIILMATVPAWLLLTLALLVKRGQTLGQYVVGLSIVRETEGQLTPGRMLVYLIALHPLIFHPLLAGLWALLAYVSISLSGSTLLFVGALSGALLCLVSPVVALGFAIVDGQRRAIHDRIAGMRVVRVE